jgi:hypothetical protein
MEVEIPAKLVLVELICETCKHGYMKSCGGHQLMSSPPQYPHQCNQCGASAYIRGRTYPYQKVVPAE